MSESSSLVFLAVLIANFFGVAMLIPQAWKSITTRRMQGVSAAWIASGLAINLGWILYGTVRQIWGLLPVSIGSLVLYGAIWIVMHNVDSRRAQRAQAVAVSVLAILAVGFIMGGIDGFGLTLALLYTVQFAPAAWTAITTRELDGLSPTTWFMSLTEASLWTFYGFAIDDTVLIIGGLGAAAMSAVVCARVLVSCVASFGATTRPSALPGDAEQRSGYLSKSG